ncbi:hypothetical protein SMACR_06917 [Sordaria macrospora]|uniref:WGS project CABT00000000 data, contig 2.38 n=2 Tax=Sordaria macrospora TaxID=5147 RepID=F7W7C8_SORMK|nr:uncharacterized protein SMAC_06917 [Sordaria macrospora k-hell]KAA8633616.1 hypothetical protein SMACR_06917 [Sordaria macrospora]KAH7634093.1 hypothetical protein B0T09DRAFT_381497 [Sordaria sp. MPI-SDFR-AT-0083]WPJ59558.1 hypothetical protein SMAC4_06917 [Sordaria macrospora]CCC13419.1 unnamed protein product [Sordaria macrospora k-hell]
MQLTKTLAVITLLGVAQAAAIPPVAPTSRDVEDIQGGQSTDLTNKVIWWKREDADGDKQSTDMINRTLWWKRGSEKEDEQSTDMINRTAWWKREAVSKNEE